MTSCSFKPGYQNLRQKYCLHIQLHPDDEGNVFFKTVASSYKATQCNSLDDRLYFQHHQNLTSKNKTSLQINIQDKRICTIQVKKK